MCEGEQASSADIVAPGVGVPGVLDVFSLSRWLYWQLDAAARDGDIALALALLQALAAVPPFPGRARLNPLREGLMTAAAFGGNPDIVRALVEASGSSQAALADINKLDPVTEQRPLHVATHLGHRLAVRALLFYGADVNAAADPAPLSTPALSDGTNLSAFPKTLLRGMSPLHWASLRGFGKIAQDLIMSGADVDARMARSGESALHLAARCGQEAVVGVLLDAGCEWSVLNSSNLTAMDLAASSNHPGALREFLCRGISPDAATNALGYSPLHQAAYSNSCDALRLLLESGGDVNSATEMRYTPLHVAAFSAAASSSSAESRPSSGDNKAEATAAATGAAVSAVRTLARYGGPLLDVDAVDANGSTPLHTACVNLRLGAVRDLLDIGADETKVPDLLSSRASVFEKETGGDNDDGGSTDTSSSPSTGARAESIARVVAMLARAPADRAWRRRGWLVVLRSRRAAAEALGSASRNSRDSSDSSSSSSSSSSEHNGGEGTGDLPRVSRKRASSDVEDSTAAAAIGGGGKARRSGGIGGGRRGSSASPISSVGGRDVGALVRTVTALEDESVFRRILIFL